MKNKAIDILYSSINSAVFIDEKAKDYFSEKPVNFEVPEEKLSEDLFNTFKENGKSLTVHKFEIANLENAQILDYLFNGRDLILLDWELAEVEGQKYSLNLLNKAISKPNINFCCIYSSSVNFNVIPFFLDAYFSGITNAEFETLRDAYSYIEVSEIQKFVGGNEGTIDSFFSTNQIDLETFPIEKYRNEPKDVILRIIYLSLSVDKYIFPDEAFKYEILNTGNNSFIINNTFVFALKKETSEDNDFNRLLERIAETIVKTDSSFFQLLGLEMQTIFNSNERFIDEHILKSSTEALFQFRNHINDDRAFGTIIKKLLLEHATLKLRTAKLKLLDSEFLNVQGESLKSKTPSNDALFNLNVFYNSVSMKSLLPDNIPNLNFGDVFKDVSGSYYLCITALCDCYYPNKIDHNFYFAKGQEFSDLELALKLGDTAFISFLPNKKVVHWGEIEIAKKEKQKIKEGESPEEFEIRKIEEELKSYKTFLYKPFYIKPKVFNVENSKLIDNKIRIWDITNRTTINGNNHNINYQEVEYITTLRDDYAQRIANHAFGHPLRVGVDFAKIK